MKKLTAAIKAMADEPRLNILIVLALRGAVCVSHLQEAMKTPQPTVSRYLAILRNAGLLEAERKGQWVYYRLNEEEEGVGLEIVKNYAEKFKDTSKIKKIMDRLDKIEQQPSLSADMEETEKKRTIKDNKANKRSRKQANVESRPETVTENLTEFEDSTNIVEGLQMSAIATSELPETKPEETIPEDLAQSVEAVVEDGETVDEKTTPEESSTGKKKGKKEKKPQPPSLFDF